MLFLLFKLQLFADFGENLRWPAFPILSCRAAPRFIGHTKKPSIVSVSESRNHDYQALGMSIGLLTTLVPWKKPKWETPNVKMVVCWWKSWGETLVTTEVANAGSLMGSEIKFGVAGASHSKRCRHRKHQKNSYKLISICFELAVQWSFLELERISK